MSWLHELQNDQRHGSKRLAALLDPDDLPTGRDWTRFMDGLNASPITDIFVGGSLLTSRMSKTFCIRYAPTTTDELRFFREVQNRSHPVPTRSSFSPSSPVATPIYSLADM